MLHCGAIQAGIAQLLGKRAGDLLEACADCGDAPMKGNERGRR